MDDMSWIWMDYDGVPALVEANYFSPDKKRLVTINKEFIDCVQNRSKPRADARAGVDAMKVVEAAMRSHAEDKAVEL